MTRAYRINANLLANARQLASQYGKTNIAPTTKVPELSPYLLMRSLRCVDPDWYDVPKIAKNMNDEESILAVGKYLRAIDVATISHKHCSACEQSPVPRRERISYVVDQDDGLDQAARKKDAHGVAGLPCDCGCPAIRPSARSVIESQFENLVIPSKIAQESLVPLRCELADPLPDISKHTNS